MGDEQIDEDMPDGERWAVALEGQAFDLDAAERLCREGPLRVEAIEVPDGKQVRALLSCEFARSASARGVLDIARERLDLLNGALFVHEPVREPLRLGAVWERGPSGSWERGHAFACAKGFAVRTRLGAVAVSVNGQPPSPPPRPPEADWLRLALLEEGVAEVLGRLRGEPNWSDLYPAYEVMRGEMEGESQWPKSRADFFRRSSQVYRHHGYAWAGLTPETAMSIEDARTFIRELVRVWLAWKSSKS